jgi:hypothetical protein
VRVGWSDQPTEACIHDVRQQAQLRKANEAEEARPDIEADGQRGRSGTGRRGQHLMEQPLLDDSALQVLACDLPRLHMQLDCETTKSCT